MLNWADLLRLEPQLIRAERIAADAHADGLDWASFWLQVATELTRLVGPLATCPELRHMAAYRIAMAHCQSIWAHGTGNDQWRHPRPWDGVSRWPTDDAVEPTTAA